MIFYLDYEMPVRLNHYFLRGGTFYDPETKTINYDLGGFFVAGPDFELKSSPLWEGNIICESLWGFKPILERFGPLQMKSETEI